ncbi:MAG: ABC transporter substrate-binding protein [Bacteroidia bacterium]|nr:ABC transporter substrate-binding protein [Bacteroidia bacterium]
MKQALPLLLVIFLAWGCNPARKIEKAAQMPPEIDPRTEELINTGRQALNAGDLTTALDAFEQARVRPFSRATTAAVYFSGITAYQKQYDDFAMQRFEELLRTYPKSTYAQDAMYHRALVQLRSRQASVQAEGLQNLIQFAAATTDTELRTAATTRIRQICLGMSDTDALQAVYDQTPASLRLPVLECLVYQLVQAREDERARQQYTAYLNGGGTASAYIGALLPEKKPLPPAPVIPAYEKGVIKIGLMLPLFLEQPGLEYINTIPQEMMMGLGFYEGFMLAVNTWSSRHPQTKVYIKTLDTRRDTLLTRQRLRELDSMGVNLVVGDIYNIQSRIISDWAETRKVPQIIPISATMELVSDKTYTFLAHPTAQTHGARLAEYAWNTYGMRQAYVFTDKQPASQELADGFLEAIQRLGGNADTLVISPTYKEALKQIPRLVKQIPTQDSTIGVYVPLMNNEEASGLIVNLLRTNGHKVLLMGSPHFRSRYTTLGRDIKDGYRLLFTSSHMIDEQSSDYMAVYDTFVKTYNLPPSEQAIQGYDLAWYLLDLMQAYPIQSGTALEQYLRTAPPAKGLHLNYQFGNQQSNQQVNIGQYQPEGIIKVN